jgi:NADPH-dependent glutamate synthase beta subunit-like oxidoreductase
MMITLTIDNQKVQVSPGTTILEAARTLGIHIATLCFADGYKPTTSCMVCVVRVEGLKSLVPACGTRVMHDMIVVTQSEQIQKARKTAVELLLSDHVGDCEGPCEFGCPANMDIPKMIRQIAAGDLAGGVRTVKKDIPLPAILGRICPAPCEKVCRRAQHDGAVSICLLKRFVADADLALSSPYMPNCKEMIGRKVAIVGAGPAGLSAAYYLRQRGIECDVYDDHPQPGGALRYAAIDRTVLPLSVVEQEISQLLSMGVHFKSNIRIGRVVSIGELKSQYNAVLLAVGVESAKEAVNWGVAIKDDKIQINRQQYSTSVQGVFAAGGCTGSRNLCIRAVADGKEAAFAIESHVLGLNRLSEKPYNHRMGIVQKEEMEIFLKHASEKERKEPLSKSEGFSPQEAVQEARRCLRCDCRKADRCSLRDLAAEFDARQKTWQGEKKLFTQITENEKLIFEPGKCIKCGLCVQTAKKEGELLGLAFEGRGFDMEIAVPLNKSLAEGLTHAALKCIDICPTGALASAAQ